MGEKSPIVSVIVPAYNEEKLLGACLRSLTAQKCSIAYEIIVVDNNSTDKTAAIARSFQQVKVLYESTPNVVAARQKGLEAARGEIVACADSDSRYPTNWVTTIYDLFKKNLAVVGIAGPAEPETNPYWAYFLLRVSFQVIELIYRLTGRVVYAGAFNFAFRKNVFLKIGGYRTYLEHGGDEFDVLNRLQKIGKVMFAPQLTMTLSTRCYRIGFMKWLFVETLYYYVLNYFLASIFKRQIIHPKLVRNI